MCLLRKNEAPNFLCEDSRTAIRPDLFEEGQAVDRLYPNRRCSKHSWGYRRNNPERRLTDRRGHTNMARNNIEIPSERDLSWDENSAGESRPRISIRVCRRS